MQPNQKNEGFILSVQNHFVRMPGVNVTFIIQQNGGNIPNSPAYTDQNGIAALTLLVSSSGEVMLQFKFD